MEKNARCVRRGHLALQRQDERGRYVYTQQVPGEASRRAFEFPASCCSRNLFTWEMAGKSLRKLKVEPTPSSESLQTTNAGEGTEKREPSCTVGGNVN